MNMKYLLALLISFQVSAQPLKDMVKSVWHATVTLAGTTGQCSGVQVKTPHGKVLILTAAHCEHNIIGQIRAIKEDGQAIDVKLVGIDDKSDLMLLTPVNGESIDIADSVKEGDLVMTATHGGGEALFMTFGLIRDTHPIMGVGRPVLNEKERKACLKHPVNRITKIMFVDMCTTALPLTVTTAWAKAGASGGAAVNEDGQLIGIISVGSETGSGLVRLSDIKAFLQKY